MRHRVSARRVQGHFENFVTLTETQQKKSKHLFDFATIIPEHECARRRRSWAIRRNCASWSESGVFDSREQAARVADEERCIYDCSEYVTDHDDGDHLGCIAYLLEIDCSPNNVSSDKHRGTALSARTTRCGSS
jgi:hypothetical protein